jgi:tRNA-dihydrouridine synthase B
MEIHLASMENVTCWAFRSLMQGVSDSYTGMFSMNYLIKREKAWKEVDTYKIPEQRQWIQIATSKESECIEFLKKINEKFKTESEKDNVYGLQLNLSCPSPNIIKIGQGSALIKRSKKVASLINELLKQEKFKISIKTRLGLNESEVKERRIFKLLDEIEKIKDPNFSQVTVHFKHAKQRSNDSYDYSMLKEISEYNIPLVINGGIKCYKDYNNIVKNIPKRKNIIGLMIGREALKNPDCFVEISNMLNKTLFSVRTFEKINLEFKNLRLMHSPREIYLNKIIELCPWYNL